MAALYDEIASTLVLQINSHYEFLTLNVTINGFEKAELSLVIAYIECPKPNTCSAYRPLSTILQLVVPFLSITVNLTNIITTILLLRYQQKLIYYLLMGQTTVIEIVLYIIQVHVKETLNVENFSATQSSYLSIKTNTILQLQNL